MSQVRSSFAEGQASEQTLIREEMNTLASQVTADIAYADLQNAYANVFASMGVDPYNESVDLNGSVGEVASGLKTLWLERGDETGQAKALASAATHRAKHGGKVKHNHKKVSGFVDPIAREVDAKPVEYKRTFKPAPATGSLADVVRGGRINTSARTKPSDENISR